MSERKVTVMVVGLPGNMALLVASAIYQQTDMELYFCGLAEEVGEANIELPANKTIHLSLIPVALHASYVLRHRKEIDIIVDFTQPSAINYNAKLYCDMGIPFVMGTTGGDRKALIETIGDSGNSAVVATNMASPVVVFQEMIRWASINFPQAFAGYDFQIFESHQSTKKDISGTAISMLPAFSQLGLLLEKEQIHLIRSEQHQIDMGVPKEHLGGHGWHTYCINSQDGTVWLEFKHNINGRNVYVDGVLRAIRFLKTHHQPGYAWTMADVLRG